MAALAPVIDIGTVAKAPSLYVIEDHLEALFNSLDMIEDPAMREACEAEIDLYLHIEIKKVDKISDYLAHLESQQEAAAAEIKRLTERKRAAERAQERLEQSVQRVMELWGFKKLEGRNTTLVLKANPPSVEVIDQSLVPQEYISTKVTESVDKTAAKNAMKTGAEIPGLKLVTDRKSVVRK